MNEQFDRFRKEVRAEFELTQGLLRTTVGQQQTQGELIGQQGEVLGEQGEMLHQQGEMLHQQGEMLHQQGEMLHQQGEMLHQQGEMLRQQGEMLHQQSDIVKKQTGLLQQHLALVQHMAKHQLEGIQDFKRLEKGLERLSTSLEGALDAVEEAPTRAEVDEIKRRLTALEERQNAA